MAYLTSAPRGTKDILPEETPKWQYLEKTLLETAELFGFREMRIPTFEHTELFSRSVGDTTDVVQKEMYTFTDKGDRSVTLRPEGTAGVARAALEHGLLGDALPLKISYDITCFRYEKPGSGRYREFHQFGVELYGSPSPAADSEVLALAYECFQVLGIQNVALEINSLGCPECRKRYTQALLDYFNQYRGSLCSTCLERLDRNPLRVLDCKSPEDKRIAAGAPSILEYLCDGCKAHFQEVQDRLTAAEIPFRVEPTIVRGLDYYTRTVFEMVHTAPDGGRLVCGCGGRYGGLIEELGGNPTEGIGFAMGLERVLSIMTAEGCDFPPEQTCDVYIASMGAAAGVKAFQLANLLRSEGFFAQSDLMGRSVKAQMKYANKIGAKYVIVLGDTELEKGEAQLKSMRNGGTSPIKLDASFSDTVYETIMENAYADLEEAAAELGLPPQDHRH